MSKYLVIVESPTKARTIRSILGADYEVLPSMGHVVDLPVKKLSIDIDNHFAPDFKVMPAKKKILSQIKTESKDKEVIYVATDPDREGEAIGWNIKEILDNKEDKKFYRVVFHEITDDALKEAFSNPTEFDHNKVDAQISRRVLDRIVGYYLSPLLWKKIVSGLSAGRVQSVALMFIVQREKEISAFIPKITYTIEAKFKIGDNLLSSTLANYNGNKAIFESQEEALKAIEAIKKEAFSISKITTKELKRKPSPPFITSSLQQDAFNKLRYLSQKTMMIAQKLYEGIPIGQKLEGLISYMRTDSFYVNPKSKEEAKKYIREVFGPNYLSSQEYKYKEKKGAQQAHEAIRPTSVYRQPQDMRPFLTEDDDSLYDLIWRRFLASFMKEALFESKKISVTSQDKNVEFMIEGSRLLFDGYLKVIGRDEQEENLPPLEEGVNASLEAIEVCQHISKPPARYNDASLVKLLEEKGIGRPSTYAPIISTLLKRAYLKRDRAALIPTELGIKVSDMLVENFPKIMDEKFTAFMEEQLDEVEEGKIPWQKILEDFFPDFKSAVEAANLVVKKHVEIADKKCPQCNSQMVYKWSRRGKFLSCGAFPKCKYAESILTEVTCPTCKEGKLVQRRNKKGQYFYGCSKYPACTYTNRYLPKEDKGTQENSEPQNPSQPEDKQTDI